MSVFYAYIKIWKKKQLYANLIKFFPKIDRPFTYKASINRPFKSTCQKGKKAHVTPLPPPIPVGWIRYWHVKSSRYLSMINNIQDKYSYFTKVMKERDSVKPGVDSRRRIPVTDAVPPAIKSLVQTKIILANKQTSNYAVVKVKEC